ncbi:class I SAM-dependent methyltransferase [Inquilinus limosus]|uniref:methyltransferase regulatory domain-containing protein n=1 Tax=Inquilinus limosus TaxID=171674 RepID=UPI003F148DF4
MSDIIDQIRDAYDTVPYDSHSFPTTSPDHLKTVAHLFGLSAPKVATSRVLELGCASGGNILPLALRYPESRVVGIDLSPVQIDAGRKAAAELGLTNIELHQGDLSEIAPTLGVFDYIICHGVYSWVPPEVQEAILRVCRENLAPDGVAFVSYNCYPGWKAKEVMRDAMILRSRHAGSKEQPLAYARGMIDFLSGVTDPNSLMGRIVAEQTGALKSFHESYLQHEFLELYNSPCYFGDFVAAAEKGGLAYLGDAVPSSMFAANFGASVAGPLLRECGDSQIRLEQYLDFVSNRTFRQTLLVHADRAGDIRYRLDGERLRQLHVAAFLPPQGDAVLDDAPRPYGPQSLRPVILPQRSVKAAAAALTAAWPGTLDFRSLMAAVEAALPGEMPAEAEAEVTDLIELLVMLDRGKVRLSPVAKPGPAFAVPEAWRRYAACTEKAGMARITNAWHDSVVLDVVERCLMAHLDGTQGEEDLIERLVECVAKGDLSFRLADRTVSDPDDIRRCAREHLDRVMAQFPLRFVF